MTLCLQQAPQWRAFRVVCLPASAEVSLFLMRCCACRLKLLPAAPWQLDGKAAAKLNQSYSLQEKVVPLLQQHDELCDLLSRLALEVKQAVAVDRDIEAKVRDVQARGKHN
jgi:hypothetical protein